MPFFDMRVVDKKEEENNPRLTLLYIGYESLNK